MPHEPRRLQLEVDCAEPLSGTVVDPEGRDEPFVGWLGLARALERVLEDEPRSAER